MKQNYNISQSDLYLIFDYVCDLSEANLANLTAYKSKYTVDFFKTFRTDISAASDMPDSIARYAPVKVERLEVVALKEDIIYYFQMLKGYINDAYPDAEINKIMVSAAGQQYVVKAKAANWAAVKSLLSAAVPFIQAHLAELKANNNMPADFLTRFAKLKTDFEAIYKSWNNKDADSSDLTGDKISSNNAIFEKGTAVLADAQIVFKRDALTAKKFTMSSIMGQIRGTRAAGLSGKVGLMGTKTMLENVKISINLLNKSVVTDKDGRFDLSPIAAGFYTIEIEAEGYETIVLENYEIKTGMIGRLKVEMQTVEQKAMKQVAIAA